jgi:hypothetical protein
MNAPSGRKYEHAYSKVNGPAYMRPNGELLAKDSIVNMMLYAPYGKGRFSTYAREIFANMLKEGLGVMMISFVVIRSAAAATGPDPFTRSIFIGLMTAASIFVALNWGYNQRLPRNLSPGATIVTFLGGRINWFLTALYLAIGFVFAIVAGAILYGAGASTIPVIGNPNNTSIGGSFCIQFFLTAIIAYTVLDQFSTRAGYPRTFPKGTARPADDVQSTPENPDPLSAYNEDIGRRPMVYAGVVFVIVTFSNLSWGLFVFNGYIYFAGAFGSQLLGAPNAFNNVGLGGALTNTYVGGAAALFILCDVAGWLLAFFVDWLTTYEHNNETRPYEDESNYGGGDNYEQANERVGSTVVQMNNNAAAASRRRKKNNSTPTSVESHLNASLWTGN